MPGPGARPKLVEKNKSVSADDCHTKTATNLARNLSEVKILVLLHSAKDKYFIRQGSQDIQIHLGESSEKSSHKTKNMLKIPTIGKSCQTFSKVAKKKLQE